MRRPSRGFRIAAAVLLLLAVGLLVHRLQTRTASPPPRVPDVWQLVGTRGDLRTSPDGPAVQEWEFVGYGASPVGGGRTIPFVVVVPAGQATPSLMQRGMEKLTGEHRHLPDSRHLWQTGDPVTTPTGKWQRFSTRW